MKARKIPRPASAAPAPTPVDHATATVEEIDAICAAVGDLGWALAMIREVAQRHKTDRALIVSLTNEAERLARNYREMDDRVRRLFDHGAGRDIKALRRHAMLWRAAAIAAGHPDPSNPYARRGAK